MAEFCSSFKGGFQVESPNGQAHFPGFPSRINWRGWAPAGSRWPLSANRVILF